MTGRVYYILIIDRHSFFNAGVREAHLITDYWMVLAVLRGEEALWNHKYVWGRTQWPLAPRKVIP